MNATQWARMKPLFHGALDQPESARRSWLREAAGHDAALLAEVERLLRAHSQTTDFLDRPVEIDPAELVVLPLDGASADPPERTRDWPPGHRIGQYEIVGVIGRGGMGVVYLAMHLGLGRRVALKVLSPDIRVADTERQVPREGQAAARITHPSVAALYEVIEADGQLVLASEYVPGPSLRRLLAEGPMDPIRARAIVGDVARGVDAAHTAGVLHRDLKPENIVVTESGSAKIVDFGIARLLFDPQSSLTMAGGIVGTPAYMAPEQLLNGTASAQSDIYAVGVILEEMLSGRHPLSASPEEPPTTGDPLTQRLREVATRARHTNPLRRFSTASELIAALEGTSHHEKASGTKRFWWEFHQGAAAVAYAAMLVPAWLARAQIGGAEGRSVFVASAVAAITASMLRLHLCFMSRQHAGELAWARRRSAPWIRLADILLVVSLVIGAGLVAAQSALDVVLLALAVGVTIAFAFIEPSTARAAGLDTVGRV